jgi:hypothetical protein
VVPKITDAVAKEILRLHDTQIDPAEIAHLLSIKKTQVSAIIAFFHPSQNDDVQQQSDGASGEPEFAESESAGLSGSAIIEEYSAPTDLSSISPEGRSVAGEPLEEETESDEGIFIGNDKEFGDSLFWNPQSAATVQNPHMMIVGESGSGKTYAVQCLTAELAQRGLPAIIFDYAQGFELDTLDDVYNKYVNVREYRIGEEGISLNPLQIFPKDVKGPASVATRVSDVFDAVYHLGHIQRKVLIEAILSTFEKVGILTTVPSTWKSDPPTFGQLQQTLDDLSSDKQYPNAKNAVGLAARLTTFFMLSSFNSGDQSWSWESMFADPEHKVHILQFRGLEGKTQKVTLEILLWHLFFYLKSHGQGKLRIYCVLDEAHHLSFREGGPVDLLLREARKFGLGIIFASQQPEDFSEAAFSNSASKLVFQTTDPNLKVSRFILAKCSNYESAESIHDVIAVLNQGDALFVTKNRGYQLRIANLRTRATLWKEA